jgi:hypothetical protein
MFFVLGPWARLHFVFAAGLSLLMLWWLKFLLLGHTEILRVMDFARFYQKNAIRDFYQSRDGMLPAAFSRARGFLCCSRT